MATADQLLKQLFSLIELKELFAENLRTLALEIELEPPGTKRKMKNVLARFSSEITEVKAIEKKHHKIETRIQKLFKRLKTESSSRDPDEVDRHVMAEVVRAMARRSEVEEQIIIHMLNRVPPSKTGRLKRGDKVVGGVVGLPFELPEAIDNWTDLIKRNRVTEAIKSLRDTADAILKTCQTLVTEKKKIIEVVDKSQREHEENKSSNPARDQSGNQQTSVEAQTDQRHEDEQEGGTGSDQHGGGDQGDKETDSDDKDRDPDYELSKVYERSEDHFDFIIYIISKLHFENIQRPPGTIKVALLNVRSMNKTGGPEKILKLITKKKMDVLLTTETWLKKNNAGKVLSKASPPNYSSHYQVRVGQRGGGVAIQFSPELQGETIPFDSITSFECVVTVLHHDEWNQQVPFINVYHTSRKKKDFLNEFPNLLAYFKNYNSIVVTGDFNIHVNKTTKLSNEFYHIMRLHKLKQHVSGPTHNRGNTLDLVLTRNVEISDLVVRNDRISDHYTVDFNARPVSKDKREETKKRKGSRRTGKTIQKDGRSPSSRSTTLVRGSQSAFLITCSTPNCHVSSFPLCQPATPPHQPLCSPVHTSCS